MVLSSQPRHRYTYAQYAALERGSTTKHEVSHRERRITIHRREAEGAWVMRVAIAGDASLWSRSVRS